MDFEAFVAKQLSDIPIPEEAKTVQEIFDTLSEEQKTVVYFLIGSAMSDARDSLYQELEAHITYMKNRR